MYIDYRCPCCNRPVKGKEDVITLKKEPKDLPAVCPHCKSPIVLVGLRDDIMGTQFYFSTR